MEISEIEQCKTWEEEMYWKYFHAWHFYLVLPKDFHDHLVLPSKFALNVSSKLPNKVSLIGPSSCSWDVEVSKTGSLSLVGDGWKDFAKSYDLEENFLMLFKYKQNSSFEVLIFDKKNLCEKEFSYFVKKPFPKSNSRIDKRSVVEAAISEMMEDNDGGGGSESVILSKKSKKGASLNGNKNNPGPPRASPLDGSSEDNHNNPEFVVSDKSKDNTIVEKKRKVLSESDRCKTWEEEMYWKHFYAMHFYQVLPQDFHVQLVLPSKFAEHMSSKLPNKVSLIGPGGATWDVMVSKTGSLALAGNGWKDFAKTYNLEENLLMIFKYKQNSSFEVLIFDQNNLCEKESSYFVKKRLSKPDYKINRKRSVAEAAITGMMEDNGDGSDGGGGGGGGGGSECVLSKKPKKGVANEVLRNMPEAPRTCPSDESSEHNHNDPDFVISDKAIDGIIIERVSSGGSKNHHGSNSCVSNEAAAQDGGSPSEAAKSKAQSGKKLDANSTAKKLSQMKEIEQIPTENTKELFETVIVSGDFNCNIIPETVDGDSPPVVMNHSPRRSGTTKGRPAKRALPRSSKKLFKSGTKRLSKEYMSNRREVTTAEIEDALRRATEAFTEGSFMVVMRPTGVYKKFYLTIPADWMHNNIPRRHQQVILRVGEKTWGTMFHYYSHKGSSGGVAIGWKNFAVQNNLEDSDVCVFKPASKKDEATLVLDVEIFRVVQEIIPLTPLVCSI